MIDQIAGQKSGRDDDGRSDVFLHGSPHVFEGGVGGVIACTKPHSDFLQRWASKSWRILLARYADVRELLVEVQHQLFNLGGELSIPGFELLKPEAVLALDDALAHFNAQLPKLAEFILPAGTRAASQAHVCRTVARRAERMVVATMVLARRNELAELPALHDRAWHQA